MDSLLFMSVIARPEAFDMWSNFEDGIIIKSM